MIVFGSMYIQTTELFNFLPFTKKKMDSKYKQIS